MSVLAGINNAATYRLKYTREGLSKQSQDTLKALSELTATDQSYSVYRKALHTLDPPCIPFLGVYLTDLTFIDDGNPDYLANGLINFGKRELVYGIISEIQQYQQISYPFPYVDNIASFLTDLPSNNDADLYTLSLIREPRNAKKEDIK